MPEIGLELIGDVGGDKKQVKLSGETFILGRSQSCAFSVLSDVASRQHTEIRFEGGKWIVADLGSSNGTFLNDRRVDKAEIRVHDVVTLGKTGARVKVTHLDPVPPPRNEDLESTHVVSSSTRGDLPKVTTPPRPAAPAPRPPSAPARAPAAPPAMAAAASAKKGGGKLGMLLFLLGAAFGVFTAEGGWEKDEVRKSIGKIGAMIGQVKNPDNFYIYFPHREVSMPPMWGLGEGVKQAVKLKWFEENLTPKTLRYVVDVVFALYFGFFLFFFAHPIRRWFWILLWAGGHLAMYLLMPK